MMTDPTSRADRQPHERRLDELFDAGRSKVDGECLHEALSIFEDAESLAQQAGDQGAADRAWLNRCAVLIAMQRVEDLSLKVFHRMRQLLMAGDDPVGCWLAAYNMAQAYELKKEYRKGTFYARIALDRARLLDSGEQLASSFNQLALLLLGRSHFDEAREAFQAALDLLPNREISVRRAAILDNLGYACVVLGDRREGLRHLVSSLRSLRRLGRRREQIFPHLRLCFAHLEVGRARHAQRHGLRALELAEEFGEPISIQYALFLLGEAAQRVGDAVGAREHFERLHRQYFPDNPKLADLLLAVDVRHLVNLKA